MQLNEAIDHLTETLSDSNHDWGCDECKAEHEQLLIWLKLLSSLDSYRNLPADILQIDSTWTFASDCLPESDREVLVYIHSYRQALKGCIRFDAVLEPYWSVFDLTGREMSYNMNAAICWKYIESEESKCD